MDSNTRKILLNSDRTIHHDVGGKRLRLSFESSEIAEREDGVSNDRDKGVDQPENHPFTTF